MKKLAVSLTLLGLASVASAQTFHPCAQANEVWDGVRCATIGAGVGTAVGAKIYTGEQKENLDAITKMSADKLIKEEDRASVADVQVALQKIKPGERVRINAEVSPSSRTAIFVQRLEAGLATEKDPQKIEALKDTITQARDGRIPSPDPIYDLRTTTLEGKNVNLEAQDAVRFAQSKGYRVTSIERWSVEDTQALNSLERGIKAGVFMFGTGVVFTGAEIYDGYTAKWLENVQHPPIQGAH